METGMNTPNEFVERIKRYRIESQEMRDAEQNAIEKAMLDFNDAIGNLESFVAMDTKEMPVSVSDVEYSYETDIGRSEVGVSVFAIRNSGRIRVEILTFDQMDALSIYLNPSKANPNKDWALEHAQSGRNIDSRQLKTRHQTAHEALSFLRNRMMQVILPVISHDTYKRCSALPMEDKSAADEIRLNIEKAREAYQDALKIRRDKSQDIEKTAIAISSLWDAAAKSLRFLGDLDYPILADENQNGGIWFVPNFNGGEIHIRHDAGYSSIVSLEAVDEMPQTVRFKVSTDGVGVCTRADIDIRNDKDIVSEIRNAVLNEIEEHETAYLPKREENLSFSMTP